MVKRMTRFFRKILLWAMIVAIPFLWLNTARPDRNATTETLFQGITYERVVQESPRPLVIHLTAIDLTEPNLSFFVTPSGEEGLYAAQTTSEFLAEFELQLALNGSFYRNASRDNEETLIPFGLTISDGEIHTPVRQNWPTLCLFDKTAVIQNAGCSAGTEQALSGNVLLLENGRLPNLRQSAFPGRGNAFRPAPRTAVALDASGQTLWLIVVDGRQPGYSEGMTLTELSEFVASLGATSALNLDGGGSSTLVRQSSLIGRPATLNAPIHNGIPTRQRGVATHLGIYAQPLNN